LDKNDISEFASGRKIPIIKLEVTHLIPNENDSEKYNFKELPCPFLKDDRCSNYDYRPKDCRSYPHLHKKDFRSRLWGVVENYSMCPIVFNVYERLQMELWHADEFDEFDEPGDMWL